MTFILKARDFIGSEINPFKLFWLKIKTQLLIKQFLKTRSEMTKYFTINYNKDNIRIRNEVEIDSKRYFIVSTFYFLDGDETVNIIKDRISLYPVIFSEAIKMIKFKGETITEVEDKCNLESEDINTIEFVWANHIIMRSNFKVRRFESMYTIAVSSDGLEFDRFYDIYDYLDKPPIFFFREKYKESFFRNLKELMEENLN